jgi:hypothetical protein
MTPEGRKVKKTTVKVRNGKGFKSILMKHNKTLKAKTGPLTREEVKNIRNHQFMPNLFNSIPLRRTRSNRRR